MAEKSSSNRAELDFEQTLWAAADKPCGQLDAAEVVPELIGLASHVRRGKAHLAPVRLSPDLEEAATQTVLVQAELLAAEWAIV